MAGVAAGRAAGRGKQSLPGPSWYSTRGFLIVACQYRWVVRFFEIYFILRLVDALDFRMETITREPF